MGNSPIKQSERIEEADDRVVLDSEDRADRKSSERPLELADEPVRKFSTSGRKFSTSKEPKKEVESISPASRDLMVFSWDNSKHSEIGNRIHMRIFEKRADMQRLYDALGRDFWLEEGRNFTVFLDKVIRKLNSTEEVELLCVEYGSRFAEYRAQGFKPDFWVTMAEAMTTECLFLDEGVHPSGEVISAWSSLISIMFAAMRDGYYYRLRQQRRLSRTISRPSANVLNVTSEGARTSSMDEEEMSGSSYSLPGSTDSNRHTTAAIVSEYFQ